VEPSSVERYKVLSEAGYDYLKPIGRGGYGHVYLFARTQNGQRDFVAGKFVSREVIGPADDSSSDAAYQRALEGLQNYRSLGDESPYLLRIFHVRQRHEAGYFCYMMELADDIRSGRNIVPDVYRPKTLKNELGRSGRRQRLPSAKCIEIATMLARGLQVLHESGFTHRDVRPSNIIFVNDVPKLADIDLLVGHDVLQTSYIPRHYAAPEHTHTVQADIFSLGKTLYEMCTGLPVDAYPTLPAGIRHWQDHRLLLQVNKVLAKACDRDLGRRYASAKDLLNDLQSIHLP
jgi:serine/threonine protein kinase